VDLLPQQFLEDDRSVGDRGGRTLDGRHRLNKLHTWLNPGFRWFWQEKAMQQLRSKTAKDCHLCGFNPKMRHEKAVLHGNCLVTGFPVGL
jgi:hypothetical protein